MQRTVHAVVAAILLSGTGGSAAFAAQSDEPYWPTSAPGAEVNADPAPDESAGSSTSPAKPAEDGGLGLAALGAGAVLALAGTGVVVHRRVRAPKLG